MVKLLLIISIVIILVFICFTYNELNKVNQRIVIISSNNDLPMEIKKNDIILLIFDNRDIKRFFSGSDMILNLIEFK